MNPFLASTLAGVPDAAHVTARSPGRRLRQAVLAAGMGLACGASAAPPVDANRASQGQLEAVRGIGPRLAALIVRERQRHGAFASFDDLAERVPGLGARRVARLRQQGLALAAGGGPGTPEILVNTPAAQQGKGLR